MYGDLPYGVFTLPRAKVRGPFGYIFYGDKPILEQNADFLRHKKFLQPRFDDLSEESRTAIRTDEALTLISRRHNCFWHWMMDSLPKVLVAEGCGFKGVYLTPPTSAAPWAMESLQLVGIPEERILPYEGRDVHVERLHIPTYFCGYNAHHNLPFTRHFKEWIRSSVGRDSAVKKDRIFVGRQPTAPQRRVINQEELASTASVFGFRVVFFEHLSLREQLALSSGCEAMIGGHGSGLTHSLFMNDGSLVIELFPFQRRQTNDCYEKLSLIAGHRYQALESARDYESNIEVPTDTVRQTLTKTLASGDVPT